MQLETGQTHLYLKMILHVKISPVSSNNVLYCTVLYCTVLHCTVLYRLPCTMYSSADFTNIEFITFVNAQTIIINMYYSVPVAISIPK